MNSKYKVEAKQDIYLFKALENEGTICVSYDSILGVRAAGSAGSIDSKVEDIANNIKDEINWVLGKFKATVTIYNKLDPRMQAVEDKSNPTRTPLPEELYKNITSALKKKVYGLKIK
jgi:hypothetical protein